MRGFFHPLFKPELLCVGSLHIQYLPPKPGCKGFFKYFVSIELLCRITCPFNLKNLKIVPK